jgi:hypothetical protein
MPASRLHSAAGAHASAEAPGSRGVWGGRGGGKAGARKRGRQQARRAAAPPCCKRPPASSSALLMARASSLVRWRARPPINSPASSLCSSLESTVKSSARCCSLGKLVHSWCALEKQPGSSSLAPLTKVLATAFQLALTRRAASTSLRLSQLNTEPRMSGLRSCPIATLASSIAIGSIVLYYSIIRPWSRQRRTVTKTVRPHFSSCSGSTAALLTTRRALGSPVRGDRQRRRAPRSPLPFLRESIYNTLPRACRRPPHRVPAALDPPINRQRWSTRATLPCLASSF